jgi:hypothetical protein
MPEQSSTLNSTIFALAGILFGWALNQFGHWYKVKKEDARVRKQVLFSLMEIYHALESSRVDFPSLLEFLMQEIKRQLPATANIDGQAGQFKKVFRPILRQLVRQRFGQEFPKIDEDYASAIKLLAPVDPLIAFELAGKTNNVKHISDWVASVLSGIGPNPTPPADLEQAQEIIQDAMESTVFAETMKDVKTLILELSGQINYQTKRRVARMLSADNAKKIDHPNVAAILKEVLDNIKNNFAQR